MPLQDDATPIGDNDFTPVGEDDATPIGDADFTPVQDDATPIGDEEFTPVGDGGKGLLTAGVNMAAGIGMNVAGQQGAKAIMKRLPKAPGMMGPAISAVIQAVPSAIKLSGDRVAGLGIERAMDQHPDRNFDELMKVAEQKMGQITPERAANMVTQFRNKLRPDHPWQEASDEELFPAAMDFFKRRYAHNVFYGQQMTNLDLAQDAGEIAEKTAADFAEGVGNVAFANVGYGEGLGPGRWARIGKAIGEVAPARGVGPVLGQMVAHGAPGAAIGAGYSGVIGGTDRALRAMEEGGGPGEMLAAATSGLLPGKDAKMSQPETWGDLVTGAAFGGGLGAGLGAVGGTIGAVKGASEARTAHATSLAQSARKVALANFADNFNMHDKAFNFRQELSDALQTSQNPDKIGATIVAKLFPDLAASPEGVAASASLAARIGPWLEQNADHVPRLPLSPEAQAAQAAEMAAQQQALAAQQGLMPRVQGVSPEGPVSPAPPGALRMPSDIEQTPLQPGGQAAMMGDIHDVGGMLPNRNVYLGRPTVTPEGPAMLPGGMAPLDFPRAPRSPFDAGVPAVEPRPLDPQNMAAPAPPAPEAPAGLEAARVREGVPQVSPTFPEGPVAKGPVPGEAPMVPPQYPESVQGPIGDQTPGFKPPTERPPVAPEVSHSNLPVSGARRALDAIEQQSLKSAPEGVKMKVSETVHGGLEVSNLRAETPKGEAGPGASGRALSRVNAAADAAGVPVDVTVRPLKVNGGTLDVAKQKEWFAKHGYEVVAEGDGFAQLRRQPKVENPITPKAAAKMAEDGPGIADRVAGLDAEKAAQAAGAVVEGKPLIPSKSGLGKKIEAQMDMFAERAEKRLRKDGGLLSGVPHPGSLRDLTVIAAARMYKLGYRSAGAISRELVKQYGKHVKPLLPKIIAAARELLQKNLNDVPTKVHLKKLMGDFEDGKVGMDWYEKTWDWLQEHYGDDALMMARFIAATSSSSTTEVNATQAMRAYGQWKLGLPFDGYISPAQKLNLSQATRGEVFGDGKMQGFLAAVSGDPNGVALDRMVMRSLGFKEAGKEGGRSNLPPMVYEMFAQIIRDAAAEKGVTPRQFQSGIWTAEKMQGVQTAVKENVKGLGRKTALATGSFRTMEHLIGEELGGKTPMQWVSDNKLTLEQLRNGSEGARKALSSGQPYMFDPHNMSTIEKPGHFVPLSRWVRNVGSSTGSKLAAFRSKFTDLIDKYHGTAIRMVPKGDHVDIEFGVNLPEHPENAALAQQIGEGVIGKNAPAIDKHLESIGMPKKGDPGALRDFAPADLSGEMPKFDPEVHAMAMDKPAKALSIYAEASGLTDEALKARLDAGWKPMTDAGAIGKVKIGKDGVAWKFIDPVGPSYNTMQPVGLLRGKGAAATMKKLEGLEVVEGLDNLNKFRSQAE